MLPNFIKNPIKRRIKKTIMYRSLEEERNNLLNQIKVLNQQINNYKSEIEGLNGQIEGLNGQIEGLNGQIGGLNDHIGVLDRDKDVLESKIGGLNGRIDVLEKNKSVLDSKIKDLNNKIDNQDNEIINLKSENENQVLKNKNWIGRLKNEINNLETENCNLKKSIFKVETEKAKKQQEFLDLMKHEVNLEKEFHDLELSYQKIENEKDQLQSRMEIITQNYETNKKDLLLKIKGYEKEIQELEAERSQIAGYSLKTDLREISTYSDKPTIMKYILDNIGPEQKILDVGFGAGIYGKLLRAFYYRHIDGIDINNQNITELGLDKIYDMIYIENIVDFKFEYYDLIIMGNVLEYIDLETANNLLSDIINKDKCKHLIVSIPFKNECDEKGEYKQNFDADYISENYPYLKLLDLNMVPNSARIVGSYVWNQK
jgi:predicted  nucleic acid-binding Zn-ribbon protein